VHRGGTVDEVRRTLELSRSLCLEPDAIACDAACGSADGRASSEERSRRGRSPGAAHVSPPV
jgi:hypothetical protein